MNNFNHFILCITIVIVNAIDKEDRSDHEDIKVPREIPEAQLDESQRKFLAQYDEAWHVSHLKDTDFEEELDTRRTECKEETFADKVKKYRRNLRNDAAFVDFVSAYALPVHENKVPDKICKKDKNTGNLDATHIKPTADNDVTKTQSSVNETVKVDADKNNSEPEAELKAKENDTEHRNKAKGKKIYLYEGSEIKDTATTVKDGTKTEDKNDTAGRRASEYLFSSIEYYDDTVDFDASVCPDAVDVIDMEIDTIREIDVQCELTLEWWSLE